MPKGDVTDIMGNMSDLMGGKGKKTPGEGAASVLGQSGVNMMLGDRRNRLLLILGEKLRLPWLENFLVMIKLNWLWMERR